MTPITARTTTRSMARHFVASAPDTPLHQWRGAQTDAYQGDGSSRAATGNLPLQPPSRRA